MGAGFERDLRMCREPFWFIGVPVSEISDTIGTGRMIGNFCKQQIPPLRCAPVGMTDYDNNFRDRTLERERNRGLRELRNPSRGTKMGAIP
jgi:hypothetical protein